MLEAKEKRLKEQRKEVGERRLSQLMDEDSHRALLFAKGTRLQL
jgi:hypothetical protein